VAAAAGGIAVLSWYRACREDGGGWLLELHVQPGAKKSGVAGLHGGALKVRIASPPVDGRANATLIEFLAKALGVPKQSLAVVKGEASRRKTVRVAHPDADPGRLLAP
jgi:uncharacterized protein (TIGR00251 family)